MANYKGRTFTSACDECGKVFTATHQYKADSQAAACYENHYPQNTRDLKVVVDEAKRAMPEVWEED
jgi:uncharacterized Zn finger protein